MLKRILLALVVVLSVLLDTAVLPLLLYGRFLIPLSLVLVILIGIQLGRISGMVYGLIAGLLLDVTAGTLGMKLFPYVIIGFLIGFLLDQQPEITRATARKERFELLCIRAIWISVLLLIHEVVMMVIQYFSTALFRWNYVTDLLLRVVLMTALCLTLYPLFQRLYFRKHAQNRAARSTREVKKF